MSVAAALGAVPPRLRAPGNGPAGSLAGDDEGGFYTLEQAMARHIEAAPERTRGRIGGSSGVAELLGIDPHKLRAPMRRLAIDWQRFAQRPGGVTTASFSRLPRSQDSLPAGARFGCAGLATLESWRCSNGRRLRRPAAVQGIPQESPTHDLSRRCR